MDGWMDIILDTISEVFRPLCPVLPISIDVHWLTQSPPFDISRPPYTTPLNHQADWQ